jgi:hypothetical protein
MRAPAAAMVAPLRPALAAARPGCASSVAGLLSAQPSSYGRRWFAAKAPAKGGAGKGGKGSKAAEEAAKLKAKAKKKKVGKAGPVKAGMGARAGDMTQLEEMLEQVRTQCATQWMHAVIGVRMQRSVRRMAAAWCAPWPAAPLLASVSRSFVHCAAVLSFRLCESLLRSN